MTRELKFQATCAFTLTAFFLLLGLLFSLCGCHGLHISIGGDVTPRKKPVDEVKPVPPMPPKDDWAPPWFRRPQPKNRNQSSVPSATANDIRDDVAAVSMTLATTAAREEAVNPAAVASLPIAERMLAAHNRIRAEHNQSRQALDKSLCRAAQQYADYLARTNQQGHFAKGGPEQRARTSGFTGSLLTPGKLGRDGWTSYGIGEVLAFGHRDIESAFQGWLDSKGHREALLERSFDVCGFGRSGNVWCAMFGRESLGAQ